MKRKKKGHYKSWAVLSSVQSALYRVGNEFSELLFYSLATFIREHGYTRGEILVKVCGYKPERRVKLVVQHLISPLTPRLFVSFRSPRHAASARV